MIYSLYLSDTGYYHNLKKLKTLTQPPPWKPMVSDLILEHKTPPPAHSAKWGGGGWTKQENQPNRPVVVPRPRPVTSGTPPLIGCAVCCSVSPLPDSLLEVTKNKKQNKATIAAAAAKNKKTKKNYFMATCYIQRLLVSSPPKLKLLFVPFITPFFRFCSSEQTHQPPPPPPPLHRVQTTKKVSSHPLP